jgi:hypothetical protein
MISEATHHGKQLPLLSRFHIAGIWEAYAFFSREDRKAPEKSTV